MCLVSFFVSVFSKDYSQTVTRVVKQNQFVLQTNLSTTAQVYFNRPCLLRSAPNVDSSLDCKYTQVMLLTLLY